MSGQRPTQVNAPMFTGDTGLANDAVLSSETALSGVRARVRALLADGAADGTGHGTGHGTGDDGVRLGEAECRSLLADVVPFGPAVTAAGVEEALAAAQAVKYPVVCKLLDPTVLHKTEFGFMARSTAPACRH